MYELERQLYRQNNQLCTYDLFGSGIQSYATNLRPMRRTEVFSTNLDHVEPGLRLNDHIHPPGGPFGRPSYEERIGSVGTSGERKFLGRRPI